jgi:heptosyltransferase I
MPRILIIKTSSLGDVIHNLPVVSDIRAQVPDAVIDWVCEAPYVDLVRLHPGVRNALPVNLRGLKRNLFGRAAWREFFSCTRAIAREHYDLVLDTQGLVKSAWIATFARGPHAGYAMDSAREPLASWFYGKRYSVARNQHAVARNRELAALALDYKVGNQAVYGLLPGSGYLPFVNNVRYAVFLHATSRADKMWPEHAWTALGEHLGARGLRVVLPWGTEQEKYASERLGASLAGAIIPPKLNLAEAAQLLARAECVIGVDTGLAHLAVAVEAPTVGLYTATHAELTGLFGGAGAVNLGGMGVIPGVGLVWQTVQRMLKP